MPGHVFLSYGRSDRGVAFRVAQRLDEEGFSVWWDPKIAPGVTYDRVIERALAQADCVVVLWSAHAVESDWVRAESDEGRRRGILVPALIEDVQPPLQFRLIETIDLTSWVADPAADAFDRLRDAVAHRAPPLEPMARWREALVGEPAMDRRRSDPRSSWVSGARFSTAVAAVVSSGDGSLSRYSVPALEEQSSVAAHQGAVWSCAANARAVVSGGTDSTARVWDPGSLDARRVLEGHQAWVLGTALSRDGATAVTGGRDGSVCVWDLASGALRHVLSGHRGAVWSVGLIEQGGRVITSSDDQTVRVWSLDDGRCLSVLRGHTAPVMATALLPDGERVLSAGYDRIIRLWDLRSAREVERLEGSADWILSLLATPDGTLAAAGTNGGEILCWDLTSLELVAQLPLHQGPVMSVDFRADAGLLSGSADKTVALLSRPPPYDERLTKGEEVVVEDGAVDLGIPGLTDAVEVARGGFSTVFRARQRAMERTVAVKLIHATVVDPVAGEHFLREVRATGRLSQHPNVAPVYDVGTTSTGQPYLIMPYYERGSLEQRLSSQGALSEGESVRLARTLATTLEYVHRHGILHRDIKPANVLLTEFDEPLLADFGVARLVDASVPVHTTGANVVTWAYGPPEAFTGGEPTAAWDIYSLGATVYAMLTGKPPFVDGGDANVFTVLNRIGNVEVPDLRDRGISPPVADAVRQTMAKDPADRPSSAAEFATMLTRPLPPPRLEPVAAPAAPVLEPTAEPDEAPVAVDDPVAPDEAPVSRPSVSDSATEPRESAPEPIALVEPEPEPAVEPEPEPGPAVAAAVAVSAVEEPVAPDEAPVSRPSVSDSATEPRESAPEPIAVVEPEPEPVAPDEPVDEPEPVAAASEAAVATAGVEAPKRPGRATIVLGVLVGAAALLSFLAIRRNLYEGYGSVLGDSFLADVGAWAPTVALAVGVVLLWRRTGVGAEWITGAGAAFVLLNYGGLAAFLVREGNPVDTTAMVMRTIAAALTVVAVVIAWRLAEVPGPRINLLMGVVLVVAAIVAMTGMRDYGDHVDLKVRSWLIIVLIAVLLARGLAFAPRSTGAPALVAGGLVGALAGLESGARESWDSSTRSSLILATVGFAVMALIGVLRWRQSHAPSARPDEPSTAGRPG